MKVKFDDIAKAVGNRNFEPTHIEAHPTLKGFAIVTLVDGTQVTVPCK